MTVAWLALGWRPGLWSLARLAGSAAGVGGAHRAGGIESRIHRPRRRLGAVARASFICLGAVLIGIGLVYQRLVFAKPAGGVPAP